MKNKKLKKRLIILGVTAVVVAGSIFGGVRYMQYKNDQKTVEVMPMTYVTTNYWGDQTSSSGNIVSDYMQELYPDSSKSISEIFVTEGQEVHIGDKLLQYNRETLELDVEAKTIAQQQVQVRIDEANRQLKKLEKTKPYVAPTPTPVPKATPTPKPTPTPTPVPTPTPFPTPDVKVYTELSADSVPYRGTGTTADPYVFLCKDGYKLNPDFLVLLFGMGASPEPTPTPTPEPSESPTPEPGPDNSPEPEDSPQPEETPTPSPSPSPSPESGLRSPFAAVFEVREHDSNYGNLISRVMLDGTGLSGTVSLPGVIKGVSAAADIVTNAGGVAAPLKDAATPTPKPTPEPDNYNHMMYTKAELDQLIAEKKREITLLQHDMKQATLDLDRSKRALENSTVLATVDGQVRTLIDIDTANAEGKPFLVVSGAQQYYVHGVLSETLLGSVNVGDMVTVNSWMNGMTYNAQIVSISDYPAEGNNYYSSASNPNSSSYEFAAVLEDADDSVQSGTYVDITMNLTDTSGSDAYYLEMMYIREDDSGYYVMKAGQDNRLHKSYITVGKSIWGGQYLEIKAGVTQDEFIAFPYGPDVKEGVRVLVQDTKEPPYPDGSEDNEDSTSSEDFPESGTDGADGPTVDVPGGGAITGGGEAIMPYGDEPAGEDSADTESSNEEGGAADD